MMQFDRIYFLGDSITLGANDSQKMGWPGRLTQGLMQGERSVATYNLGVNGDTSQHIRQRWRSEVEARNRNATGLLLFAFGFNDASNTEADEAQVSLQDSIANAEAIISEAKQVSRLLWIGPTPLDESVNPMVTPHATWKMYNQTLAEYDQAYADLADAMAVPYLQLFPEFLESSRYLAALISSDKVHPGDDGYQMITERIAAWDPWLEAIR
jgi:acyl-CoA thioesterase-1